MQWAAAKMAATFSKSQPFIDNFFRNSENIHLYILQSINTFDGKTMKMYKRALLKKRPINSHRPL